MIYRDLLFENYNSNKYSILDIYDPGVDAYIDKEKLHKWRYNPAITNIEKVKNENNKSKYVKKEIQAETKGNCKGEIVINKDTNSLAGYVIVNRGNNINIPVITKDGSPDLLKTLITDAVNKYEGKNINFVSKENSKIVEYFKSLGFTIETVTNDSKDPNKKHYEMKKK